MNNQLNNKGFSLVEILIAVAIAAVIASALFVLMNYTSNSMNQTQARVELQEEARDIVNHITAASMEASDASEGSSDDILLITNDTTSVPERKEVVYWHSGNHLFYASTTEVSPAALPTEQKFLLGAQVEDFKVSIEENPETDKKTILVNIKMKNDNAEFECSNRIFIRNQ